MRPILSFALACFAAGSAAVAQDAQEAAPAEASTNVDVTGETGTSTYVPARPVERLNPPYPAGPLSSGKEGWVMLSFVISPDGAVTEPMIEDSSGVESFERAALRAVESWKYTPATQDGEPVEQAMTKTRIQFQLEDKAQGASPAFVSRYRRIARLINDREFAAAEPLIAEVEFGERTNLYEDAWFWWMKYVYLSASGSADTDEMRRSLQRAIGYEQEYLTPEQFVAAAERLIILHAQALDVAAAIATFERLRDAKTARRVDVYQQSIANLQPSYERMLEIVRGDQLLVTKATVGKYDYWVHDLLRCSFAVADVEGRLDVLDIRCTRATRRYLAVPADTVWSIPASWGDCGVYLKGEPGTTFAFREYPLSYVPLAEVDVAEPGAP